ncbi:heme-binding protein [Luminiphilus sp.]|jgi:hypothetical protein|nr:heme-binding protein [Luminiphilus sp.]
MIQHSLLAMGLLAMATLTGSPMAAAIEEPQYEVVTAWEEQNIELRSYAPRILAVTTMTEGQNNGFRVLAGYIFGGNSSEQKIAMTAPVQRAMDDSAEMAFMMPAEYRLSDLPTPADDRVSFREAPGYTAAVIQFSGWADMDKAEENWQVLQAFLTERDINIEGQPSLNQYNPPWTLPFLRRNEIIVPISMTDAAF